jgi:hypothetical protein
MTETKLVGMSMIFDSNELHLSKSRVSKLFDMLTTYDFALEIAGQRTQRLRLYIHKQMTNYSK